MHIKNLQKKDIKINLILIYTCSTSPYHTRAVPTPCVIFCYIIKLDNMKLTCDECQCLIDIRNPEIIVESENTFCSAECKHAFDNDVALFNSQQQAFVVFMTETELSYLFP